MPFDFLISYKQNLRKILKTEFLKPYQKINFQYFYFIVVPTIATGI